MAAVLIPFVLFDIVIMAVVVWYIVQRRKARAERSSSGVAAIVDLDSIRALATFAKEQHERIGQYMRTNWSGMPDQLPGVLTALLIELERDAIRKGVVIEHGAIKTMLGASLRAHKIGSPHDVREALDKVA
jgi:hypothetical protein